MIMFWPAKKTSYKKGIWAENYALTFLRLKGYCILEKRFKTRFGEIDIIASKGKSLHFIEVKQRDCLSHGLYAITPYQRKRIERASQLYLLQAKECPFEKISFDAIIIYHFFCWKHIISAWRLGDYQ